MRIHLKLNGADRQLDCAPGDSLLAVLRREGCFSVRYGSGTGETGAAAVLVDGRLVAADVLLAAQAGGHDVTTVEHLNTAVGMLHPIQQAIVDEHLRRTLNPHAALVVVNVEAGELNIVRPRTHEDRLVETAPDLEPLYCDVSAGAHIECRQAL